MERFVVLDKNTEKVVGSVYEDLNGVLLRSMILKTENPTSHYTVVPHCFSSEEDEEVLQTVMRIFKSNG